MKRKKIILFSMLSIFLMISVVSAAYWFNNRASGSGLYFNANAGSSWHDIAANPQFYSASNWGVWLWDEDPTKTEHDYWLDGNELAYTGFNHWGSVNKWGNTQYAQGRALWGFMGDPIPEIPLTVDQRILTRFKCIDSGQCWLFGRNNLYIELWIEFSEPVGTKGYQYAEIMICLRSDGGWFIPAPAGEGQYWAITRVEPDVSWYYVGYRCWQGSIDQWTWKGINLNTVIQKLESSFEVDLSKGKVIGITFGVEGTRGRMGALFDYVYYQAWM